MRVTAQTRKSVWNLVIVYALQTGKFGIRNCGLNSEITESMVGTKQIVSCTLETVVNSSTVNRYEKLLWSADCNIKNLLRHIQFPNLYSDGNLLGFFCCVRVCGVLFYIIHTLCQSIKDVIHNSQFKKVCIRKCTIFSSK